MDTLETTRTTETTQQTEGSPQKRRGSPSTETDHVEHRGRRWLLVVLVAVIALLIGVVVGWMIGDSDSDEPVPDIPAAVAVRGNDLTEREQEMVRVGDEFNEAMRIGDGGVVDLFTERGVLTIGDRELRVDDGTIVGMMTGRTAIAAESFEPTLVFDDAVIYSVRWSGGNFLQVLRFTEDGPVLIRTAETVNLE